MRRTLIAAIVVTSVACSLKDVPPPSDNGEVKKMSTEYYGLRAVRYSAGDLAAAKRWYSDVLGQVPYLDQPAYVGFNVGGFELGIVHDTTGHGSATVVYWGVADAARSYARL